MYSPILRKWCMWLQVATLVCIASGTTTAQDLLIQNIEIIDLEDGTTHRADVQIIDGKIDAIAAPKTLSESIPTLDGSDRFLVPGLIDAHIHLFQSGGIYTRPDAIDLRAYRSYQEERTWLRSHANDFLRRYLRCGITTVIDVGGPMTNYEIREENRAQHFTSTLFTTGPLVSTYQPEAFDIEDPPIIKVHSTTEARELVRKQLPSKPDFIKIWYISLPNQSAESTYEIVEATIDESHQNNLLVAVHATQLNTAKLALKAGADLLVHSVDDQVVDDDFIKLLNRNDAVYVPTLRVSSNYGRAFTQTLDLSLEDFNYSHPIPLGSIGDLKHLEQGRILSRMQESEAQFATYQITRDSIKSKNLKILQKNNCTIATGTDAGNIGTLHASSYFHEIEAMQSSGLSNLEILRASTLGGAAALKKQHQLGSVEEGKIADLLILNTNPIHDLAALRDIRSIIKGGHLIDPDTLVRESPINLVQQQLNGYNARNMEAFLAPYSNDIKLFNFHETEPWAEGKSAMREIYQRLFDRTPALHCQLVNRIVQGNTVIDRERVTGFGANDPLEATAIYETENGKITRVYFLR